ncbi:hypothetical protein M2360_000893 [Rhizobium sp. SG_E_25_P2]|uniref:hypothetical protein n=1 Tax=Rhizobium sp. SG_E_25_P2 TaxID=2879942 RepID=UPI002473E150|nr:hypothetical protein [Rhizobium sp. SG_E_25_P2]MDH6265503.1 hypothetical protein [Rhizobium sp. SG_E_25_P2]
MESDALARKVVSKKSVEAQFAKDAFRGFILDVISGLSDGINGNRAISRLFDGIQICVDNDLSIIETFQAAQRELSQLAVNSSESTCFPQAERESLHLAKAGMQLFAALCSTDAAAKSRQRQAQDRMLQHAKDWRETISVIRRGA